MKNSVEGTKTVQTVKIIKVKTRHDTTTFN